MGHDANRSVPTLLPMVKYFSTNKNHANTTTRESSKTTALNYRPVSMHSVPSRVMKKVFDCSDVNYFCLRSRYYLKTNHNDFDK